MSKNTKRLLIILILAAAFCIVASAVAIGAVGLFANNMKDNVAIDPDKAHDMAAKFISYELPSGYTERVGFDFFIYQMIMIGSSRQYTSKPLIVVTNFTTTQGTTPEQMTEQMQKSLERNGGGQTQKLTMTEVETREVTIDGKDATLSVREGTDQYGDEYRQWVTNFEGKSGLIILLIQGPVDEWDDAAFNDFLASISTK